MPQKIPDKGVRFLAVPRLQIPTGRVVAASFHHDGWSDWFIDEDNLDLRIIHQLEANGVAATALLKPRPTPRTDRWGLVQLTLEDISIDGMKNWRINDVGLSFPVPRTLITPRLAAEISVISTSQLDHFELK